jgi:large-conductance mechanosensitive channel
MVVRASTRLEAKKAEPAEQAPEPDPELKLLEEIRDLLKASR